MRSIGLPSSGAVHRYTGTGTTSAPASRSASQKSGIGSHSVVAPCNCTAIRVPLTPSRSRCSRTSAEDSDTGLHSSRRSAARMAPFALGPRASKRDVANARPRLSARPHPSAASIQPRKPIPVVATVISGGLSMMLDVTRSNSASSASGMIRIAGACITDAPRRTSSVANSSALRDAVIPTANPASGSAPASKIMSIGRARRSRHRRRTFRTSRALLCHRPGIDRRPARTPA